MIEDTKHYMQHTEPQPITPEYEAKMRADYEAVRTAAESFGATINARYVRDLLFALVEERKQRKYAEEERDENESAFQIWRRRTRQAEFERDEAVTKIREERANALLEVADKCDGEFPDFTKWLRSLAEAESKKGKVA